MIDISVSRFAVACALIALVLTGCSAPSAEAPAAHGEASSEEAVVLPAGFPTDDVPLFDGPLLNVAHPGNLWAAWIGSEDLVADLATASQQLIDAGYVQTTVADGWGEFTNPDRSLRIVASVDPEWGSCLMYTFTDGAIEATDAPQQDAPTEAPAEH